MRLLVAPCVKTEMLQRKSRWFDGLQMPAKGYYCDVRLLDEEAKVVRPRNVAGCSG